MSDDPFANPWFGPALRAGASSAGATELPGQTHTRRVRSLLFDGLRLQAGSGAPLEGWQVETVSIALPQPTRRRVRITLRGLLAVVRKGEARASLACESRHAATGLVGREALARPDGSLPGRDQTLALSLVLPRSAQPRTAIRLVVLLEATAESADAQAEATVDSIDLEAL